MRAPVVFRACRVELTPEGGIDTSDGALSIEETGIRFRPFGERTAELWIDIQRVVGVERVVSERLGLSRACPGLAIRLPEQVLRFSLTPDVSSGAAGVPATGANASSSGADASSSSADASDLVEHGIAAVRRLMAAQFAHGDEVRVSLLRGSKRQGQHAVVAVSDLSWGQDSEVRPIMIQVWSPRAAMAWKRKVLLSRDVHAHLRKGFDALGERSGDAGGRDLLVHEDDDRRLEPGASLRELGTLLLRNTLTPHALDEIEKLRPSFVTLVIDEWLADLPWNSVHDGDRQPLLDLPVAQQISTLEPLRAAGRPARRGRQELLVISNPTLDLPNAEREAASVLQQVEQASSRRLSGVEHLAGEAATRVAVLSAVASGRHGIIHYAGHSRFNAAAPSKSAWLLHDGPLTAAEMHQNIPERSLHLVYSSSCEGGREGEPRGRAYGERLLGMASAFLAAATRSYVGAYWPVGDAVAADLATLFYGELLGNKPIAHALRTARQQMMHRVAAPLLVSGTTLFGDPALQLSDG